MRKLLLFFIGTGLMVQSHARDFHLDSRQGDDSNDGKSESAAWKSFAKWSVRKLIHRGIDSKHWSEWKKVAEKISVRSGWMGKDER